MRFKNQLWLLIGSLGILASCNTQAQQSDLSVPEFEKAIAQNDIQVLDVRTPGEYESGHLKNAMLADWNNETEFKERVKSLDKNKTVYTYCLSGGRSGAATEWLKQNGFNAFNLNGGIIAWKNAGKSMEQTAIVKQIGLPEYFAQIPNDKTVLVDFSASWCPPCKKMAPVLDSLVKTNGSQFVLLKIDGAGQTNICKELKIDGFPTFIIYKQGKETWRKQGIVAGNEFVEKL
ncbi:MAG: thioredoxin domain-containing protein [Ferruginibacter sp.]